MRVSQKQNARLKIVGIILLALVSGVIAYPRSLFFLPKAQQFFEKLKLNLGLDLQGGVHLEYEPDIEKIKGETVTSEAIQAAQAVVERRVNAFGVSEPLVQTAQSSGKYRIIVELPGVKDIEEAKGKIKEAPFLEFKEEDAENTSMDQLITSLNEQTKKKADEVLGKAISGEDFTTLARDNTQDPTAKENGGDLGFLKKGDIPELDGILFESDETVGSVHPQLVDSVRGWSIVKKQEVKGDGDTKEVKASAILFRKYSKEDFGPQYKSTGLSGKHLKSARVDFGGQQGGLGEPQVAIQFDDEGKKLFADITKRNLNKTLAIYIDGELITAPTVQAEITNGEAVITGQYTVAEANVLKKRLDEGALPVPLTLVSQQSIEASLGQIELRKSITAGFGGFAIVALFMILYYRFLGVVATLALALYSVMLLSLFKLSSIGGWPWPITLSLSGIAGFILSIGMAVDANVLIFERIKEEFRKGKSLRSALHEGFHRAWPSIRDGNLSTLLTAFILIWFGTGFVKGFAIILSLGVLLSMFTAVVIVRTLLLSMPIRYFEKHPELLFPVGKHAQKEANRP